MKNAKEFRNYLEANGHTKASAYTRSNSIDYVESVSGTKIDDIVSNDMATGLVINFLRNVDVYQKKHNTYGNAVRHYYKYVNGKAF